jgi:cytoskeletal protein RodZ
MSVINKDESSTTDNNFVIIGSILKSKRIGYGLTVEELAKKTNLNHKYIAMIESGDFVNTNRKIYYYGYIKSLGLFLNVDTNKLLGTAGYYDNTESNIKKDDDEVYVISKNKIVEKKQTHTWLIKIAIVLFTLYALFSFIKQIVSLF